MSRRFDFDSVDRLVIAAEVSVSPPFDWNSPHDPLRRAIPGDGPVIEIGVLADVEDITGRRCVMRADGGTVVNSAPWARAALRRWAVQQRAAS